jgi:hypothetical protein
VVWNHAAGVINWSGEGRCRIPLSGVASGLHQWPGGTVSGSRHSKFHQPPRPSQARQSRELTGPAQRTQACRRRSARYHGCVGSMHKRAGLKGVPTLGCVESKEVEDAVGLG